MKWNVSRVRVRTETQRMRIKDGVRTEHLGWRWGENGALEWEWSDRSLGRRWGENGAWNAQALRDKRED